MNFITTTSSTTFMQCASKATDFGEITKIRAITPFKLIQGHRFGTNRKVIYDFLLVINTNVPPILHRFRDIVSIGPKSLYLATPLAFNSPRRKGSLYHIIVSDISLKTRCFGLDFGRRKFRYIFSHIYTVRPGSYRIR